MSVSLRSRAPAVAASVLGPASFAVAAVRGARRVPGYRHLDEPISALAARGTDSGGTMVAGFLGLGAGTLALARQLRSRGVPGPVPTMMMIASAGTIGSGLARQSDRSCPSRFLGHAEADLVDELHVMFGAVTFGMWIAMPFTAAARNTAMPHASRRSTLALGVSAFAAWCATATLAQQNAARWGGLAQRVTVVAALAWFPIAAWSLGAEQ